jgi:hypothetical protein
MSEAQGDSVGEQLKELSNEEIRNRIKMFEGNMKSYKL